MSHGSAVKGRLPNLWRIHAHYDDTTGFLNIRSPDTERFVVNIDMSTLHEYSTSHKPSTGMLEDAQLEAKFDGYVLRFDCRQIPEFWLEVSIEQILMENGIQHVFPNPFQHFEKDMLEDCIQELCNAECLEDLENELMHGYDCTKKQAVYWLKKKYIYNTSYGEDLYNLLTKDDIMPWTQIFVDEAVLTLWPGIIVKNGDWAGPEGLLAFFKQTFDIEPTPVGCVMTLPDKDEQGFDIEDTGNRCDFFFYVNNADIVKFAVKRFKFHMRWWEDVFYNETEHTYPIDFRSAYPV